MTRRDFRQMHFLIAVSIAAWTYLFPALNWPDEVYKLSQLPYDTNLYAQLINILGPGDCNVQTHRIGRPSYLSNNLHVGTIGPLGCYYALKSVNAALVFLLVLLGYFLLRNQTARTVFLLSMIWPSIVFYSTSINQQSVFTVVSIFLATTTLTSRKVWPALLASIPLILIDRSFVTLTIFLSVLTLLKLRPRSAFPLMIFSIIAIYFLRPYALSFSSSYILPLGTSIGEISEQLERLRDPIHISFALLGVSFVYLGGTNSLLGIGFDYFFVFTFLSFMLFKKCQKPEIRVYFFAFILSYILVVGIIPSIQTFRYYVFFMPCAIYFLVDTEKLRKTYIGYSLTMSGIYLALSHAL